VKFGPVIFEISKQTDKKQTDQQTHKHADQNASRPYWGEIINPGKKPVKNGK